MRLRRSIFWLLPVAAWLSCATLLCAQTPAGNPKDILKFKWAFVIHGDDGTERTVDFGDKVSVTNGDAIRIFLEPVTNAYIYLFMFDSRKQLRCLFPSDPALYDRPVETGKQHLLPPDSKWFVMDQQKGTEKFFLLASTQRLTSIEDLTRKMLASPDDAEIKAALLDEIQLVRRGKADLKSPVEKSVPIAGTVVAVTRGATGQATLTEASGFYARTLRMEHE